MPQVYLFWTQFRRQDVRAWKWSELLEGRLRQGWGGPGTQLVERDQEVTAEVWLARFTDWVNSWNASEVEKADELSTATTRYQTLRQMPRLQEGDLLVVPRMPSDEDITLAVVAGGYRWQPSGHAAANAHGLPDFGHVVEVDPKSLITFSRDSSPVARALAAKFSNYRSPITRVAKADYAQIAWQVLRP